MIYILLLILCSLATLKLSLQSSFGKKSVKNTADALYFNGLIFLFSSFVFMYTLPGCPWQVWVYGAVAAVFSVAFQILYTKALSAGNVSLTALIVNMSMVINVIVSYVVFGDSISSLRLVGIILTIITFFLCTDFKNTSASEKSWIYIAFASMITNAVASLSHKFFTASDYSSYNLAFTSGSYFIAAVVAFMVYGIYKITGSGKTFKAGKSVLFYSMATGVVLAVFIAINTYTLTRVEGTFIFPAYSGGTIIFSTLTGIIFFKDKLSAKQILSLIVGAVAIVLMNF